ncbi:hypothetical protein [Bradyrhizobium huanghuaihaiense]|uniref:hypothetical protein n=1 Tax=Bradyrhizobium huanghuaihaiense TaxID=990078 RepID=UPI00119FB10A|nr:hypothetical protein [Bradyrhizobium huanghuaihaiense]
MTAQDRGLIVTATSDLHRLAAALEAGAELTEADRIAAAEALRAVMPAKHAERDALIQDCRRRYFADLADHAAAHEISRGLSRYAASGWRRDRAAVAPPGKGTRTEMYWLILNTAPPNPHTPSPSTIRRILAKLR